MDVDYLFDPFDIVYHWAKDIVYFEFGEGYYVIADLCTPIYDSLGEKW